MNEKKCIIKKCDEKACARGMCKKHYKEFYRYQGKNIMVSVEEFLSNIYRQ